MVTTYGKNDLNARAIFDQRQFYEIFAYPFDQDVVMPMDIWRQQPFYGRINNDGTPIYPLESQLARLNSSPDKDLFVLNFVRDAFEDFRKNFLFINKEDVRDSAFEFMIPHQAYSNPVKLRDESMSLLYDLFTNSYLLRNKRYEEIVSFRSFLKVFKKFMREVGGDVTLTLTNYLISTSLSPLSSGIMVEIAEASYAEDETKCRDFLQNVCFPCYTLAAQKFGFKVDKNVPWRLIADLKSPCMQKYMSKYYTQGENPVPVSFNNFFNTYYNKSYLLDIFSIQDTLARFYFSYINENPFFTRYSFSGKCGAFKKKVIKRKLISKEMIAQHFSQEFWLNYYIEILSYEIKEKKTFQELRLIVVKAQTKLNQEGFASAVKYVFESFKENLLTISSNSDII